MRIEAIAAIALLLEACETTKGASIALVETDPPGALVQVEGFGECTAPCTIELDAPRSLTIAKAGYDAQRLRQEPFYLNLWVEAGVAGKHGGAMDGSVRRKVVLPS